MTIDAINFELVLLGGNALLLAAAGLALIRFQRRCSDLQEFWNSPTGSAIARKEADSENPALASTLQSTQRMEQKLLELQRAVTLMEVKAKSPVADEKYLPIGNAMRMAKSGASIDDLRKTCGLNTGEAQLMMKLHGQASMHANASARQ